MYIATCKWQCTLIRYHNEYVHTKSVKEGTREQISTNSGPKVHGLDLH